jgi:hypothetical protein
MRKIFAGILSVLKTLTLSAQNAKDLVLNQPPSEVDRDFWPNLHHVLWAEAWARRP